MENAEMVTITKEEYEYFLGLKSEVTYLKFQLAELKRLIYGAKRERFIPAEIAQQPTLFELPEEDVAERPTEEISYTRNKPQAEKKHPLRLELPAHLERRDEIIEPEEIPEHARKIGEAITEVIEYEPASAYVRRIIRPKYIVEQNDEETRIVIAPLPTLPIPKGNAGASMLSHILISKFVNHLPFYRQVQIFKRQNLNIAESTIGGWFSATCNMLLPLYEALKSKILSSDYLMADETPIPVTTKDKPGSTHKGYYWVYYDPLHRLLLFDYRQSRGRDGPDELLKNFRGYLQTDGYVAYEHLEKKNGITLLACMAHARRKFEHASENSPATAGKALSMFQRLYAIEEKARIENLSVDQIKELRQAESKPILDEMEQWMKEQIVETVPRSAIGMAFAYTLSLWPRLVRYIEDGRFQIDNNLIENSIRPVALGRKNYLFAGSHQAAHHAAMMYSILETCKINDIEPFQYLTRILSLLPDCKANQLHILLPGQN